MADNTEEVVYQFTGDVSSLRQATESALSLLGKYQAQIDRISNDGGFGKNTKAAKSFQTQLNATTKQIAGMQKQMTGIADVRLFPSNQATQQLQGSLSSINQVYGKLASSTSLSTGEVKNLTAQLRSTIASLKGNSTEIASLIQKERQWQQTLETVRVKTTQVRDTLDGFKSKIAGAFNPMLSKLQALSAPFTKLTTRLQIFKDKAAESFGKITQLASTVSAAFRRVSSTENDSADAADRSTRSHTRLSSALSKLLGSFKKETAAIGDEEEALDSKSDALQNTGQQHSSLGNFVAILGNIFSSETSTILNFTSGLKKTSGSAKALRSILSGLISLPIAQWLTEAAKKSIDFAENVNLFTVAMGDSLDVGSEFIAQMAEIYGMDPSNLMRYAGNFYQLADAIDMPDAAAANLSLSLVRATNDISSLFNIPIDEVFSDLSSGMQGMSRAVRKYGMDIRTTTLQQTALSLGITKQVSTMSEANRQGLRFITMMRQASNASGDFARTIESPANQLKIFKEQMSQLGRAIGDLFIKPLSTALQYINGFVMALRMVISFIGNVLGVVNNATEGTTGSTEEVAGSIDAIGDSAAKATKKLKAMVAPFDELNILGSQADDTSLDVGTLDPAIQQAIEDMELSLENIKMKANEVRDSLLQFFGFKAEDGLILSWDSSILEENLINRLPQWTQTIQATFANWGDIAGAFGDVLDALGGIAQTVWKKLSKIFKIDDASLASFIEDLDDKIGDFADTLRNNEDTIANFAIVLGTLAVAFRAFTGLYEILLPIVQVVSHLVTTFSGLLGIIGILGILYTSSTDFATAFDTLIQSVVAGLGTVLTSAWSTLQTIVSDIVVGIVPLFTSLGEALAPVVNTVTELWNNVTSIVSDAFQSIETMWNDSLKPVFDAVIGAFDSIASIFQTLWTQVLGPVIDHIGDGIESLWKDTLKPIVENVVAVVSGIIELVLRLWNHVLGPVVNWLVSVLGPTIKNVINWVWDFIKNAFAGIGGIINGLLEVIRGVIDFIVGVFTGDWERAWNGVKDIFKGVWDALVGVVKSVMNGVIWLINGILGGISGAINGIINAINGISFDVPDWVPGIGGTTYGFSIPNISDWQIPYLASGAVVTSPTVAMVGEGKYDEAVIPLGNSPQMRELVDRIAEATRDKGGSNEPVQVNVFIGNEQIAEFVHRADKRRQLQTNGGV